MNNNSILPLLKKPFRALMAVCFLLLGTSEAQAGVTVTIPTLPATDTTSYVPTNRRAAWSACRMIYTAAEVGTTGTITNIGFYKSSGSTSTAVNYIDIYLKETSATTVTTTIPTKSTYTKVYSGPLENTMSSGWTSVTLSALPGETFAFSGGTNNLDILIFKSTSEAATANFPVYTYTTTTGINTTAYYAGSSIYGSTYTAVSQKRPNIQLTVENTCSGKPAKGLVAGPSTAVCSAGDFTLSGSGISLGAGMHYQWQRRTAGVGAFVNMTADDTFSTLTTSTLINRDYRIVSICNFSGQSDTSAFLTINVLNPSTITPSGDTTFCSGGSVLLTTTSTSGATYTWYKDGSTTGATGTSYTATSPGFYSVKGSTTGCSGIASTNTIKVTVNTPPTATATALSTTTFCDGNNVILQGTTGTGLKYQWQKAGIDVPGATADQYTATAAGAFRVKVTDNVTGCFAYSTPVTVTVNPSPVAPVISAPGGATSYCASGSLTLSTVPVSGVSYQWEISTGNISGATTSSYIVSSPETYTLVATLGSCSTRSNSVIVKENPLPMATITPSGTTSFCNGDSLRVAASAAAGQTYQWLEGGVAIPGAPASAFYWVKNAGKYSVKITVTATGCSDISSNLEVNLISPSVPVITAAGPASFCIGSNVTLNATVASGLTLQWQESGTDISGASAATYNTATAGKYRMKVTNGVGCPAYSNIIDVKVNPLPSTSISVGGPLTICNGETVTLTAPIITGHSYQWRESSVDLPGVTRNPLYAGKTGYYSVHIKDSNGCEANSADIPVTVKFVQPFSITPHGNTYFCDGNNVELTTQAGYLSYQWFYNGTAIGGANDTFIHAAKSGTYTVRVEDPFNGCFAKATGYNIVVIPSPDSPRIVQTGAMLHVPKRDGLKYQWFMNGIMISGAVDTFINATADGLYSVQVTNLQECMKEGFIRLGSVGIPDAGNAGYQFKVYPNPASDNLTIEAPDNVTVTLSDIQGKVLFRALNAKTINMSQVAAGMYLVIFTDNTNRTIGVEKISKTAW